LSEVSTITANRAKNHQQSAEICHDVLFRFIPLLGFIIWLLLLQLL